MRARRRGSAGPGPRILLVLVLLVVSILLFNRQIRPVMESETVNAAKVRAVGVINSVVLNEIGHDSVSYDSLVHIDRDADGRVLSVTSDVMKMNAFKAKTILDIQKQLDGEEDSSVKIPIGTLIGGNLFHGLGPALSLKVTLAGNVQADFKSTFESAGVNQTRHRIYLSVGTSVYSFLPGINSTTDISTDVLVAETVIVGEVPQVLVSTK